MAETYVKIATVDIASTSTNFVTFSSIPQSFTDLVIKASLRSTKSGFRDDNFSIQPNGATSPFTWIWIYSTGSSTLGSSGTNAYGALYGTAAASTANIFSNAEAYIPNYTRSGYKNISVDNVNENNATANLTNLVSFTWQDTPAITSLTITAGGGNIEQYSSITLYGISKS